MGKLDLVRLVHLRQWTRFCGKAMRRTLFTFLSPSRRLLFLAMYMDALDRFAQVAPFRSFSQGGTKTRMVTLQERI